MKGDKPRTLIISSANPVKGPGVISYDRFMEMKRQGFDVDFLTHYKVEGHPEILYVEEKKESKFKGLLEKIKTKLKPRKSIPIKGHYFFYKNEEKPPVAVSKVLEKINDDYDWIIIHFWQGLLSFRTVEEIYRKTKAKIFFICADYSTMSGGCHFPQDCKQYITGCGSCPAWKSNDSADFTHKNILYRKKVYDEVKPTVLCNTFMAHQYRNAFLFKDHKDLITVSGRMILDLNVFRPIDKNQARKELGIDSKYDKILFFGSSSLSDTRKGMKYLIEALHTLYKSMSNEQRERTFLLIAGNGIEAIKDELDFDYKHLGYVKTEKLPILYSAADAFVCSSVNDAGPSMINQALACGTPVVSFETGAALDVVVGKGTGFCAKERDTEQLARAMRRVIEMPETEYMAMSKRCREVAEKYSSQEENVLFLYDTYLNVSGYTNARS